MKLFKFRHTWGEVLVLCENEEKAANYFIEKLKGRYSFSKKYIIENLNIVAPGQVIEFDYE